MNSDIINLSHREGCLQCFKTLDANDSDPKLQEFVRCEKCDAVYHRTCWELIDRCVNFDGSYQCDSQKAKPITVSGTVRQIDVPTRTAIRFEGIKYKKPLGLPQPEPTVTQSQSPTITQISSQPVNTQQSTVAMQKSKTGEINYRTKAYITLVGYFLNGLLGLALNLYFIYEARKFERTHGYRPQNVGCLWSMIKTVLALYGIAIVILVISGSV